MRRERFNMTARIFPTGDNRFAWELFADAVSVRESNRPSKSAKCALRTARLNSKRLGFGYRVRRLDEPAGEFTKPEKF